MRDSLLQHQAVTAVPNASVVHPLLEALTDRIGQGLRRKSIVSCSRWAEAYRVMPVSDKRVIQDTGQNTGLWSFKYYPWTRKIHDSNDETIAIMKGAQLGLTETGLNRVFFTIDVKGYSALYVLPASTPDAADFSTARFDSALDASPHLQKLFSDVKNIGHKRAGNASLYVRGSRSRSQLKSIPVHLIVFDEVDEMNPENIPLALERVSGQFEHQVLFMSTPTITGHGIDVQYKQSTQDHYYFRCPHCNKMTELIFPDCLVITAEDISDPLVENSYIQCKECHHPLDHEAKPEFLSETRPDGSSKGNAQWISSFTDYPIRGFHINQLYSSTQKPSDLALSYLKGLTNATDEQEFYNSKLGQTHEPEGARVLHSHLESCTGNFTKLAIPKPGLITTMGIDVGKWIHYEITQWQFDPELHSADLNLLAKAIVIQEGKVLSFEELDPLVQQYQVTFGIMDAQPERRKALEFAQRFWGRFKLCFYTSHSNSKHIHTHAEDEHSISVDRTSWMDLALGRFRTSRVVLPKDLSMEYKAHVQAPVRIMKKDSTGNPIGIYVVGNNIDDHFAHARTYSEIGLQFAASLARNQDIQGVI
jgi:hypothetical protein